MSLNIKNERVHDLARTAAQLSGKSQTAVIQEALEDWLARHADAAGRTRLDRARELVADMQRRMREGADPGFSVDDLYGEDGLPR
jgi:antitoxin VapB